MFGKWIPSLKEYGRMFSNSFFFRVQLLDWGEHIIAWFFVRMCSQQSWGRSPPNDEN
jgi:hypothetical protein